MTRRRPLILSTGMFRQAFSGRPNEVNSVLDFYAGDAVLAGQFDGVELNLRTPEALESLTVSRTAQRLVEQLPHNTLHYFYLKPIRFKSQDELSDEDGAYVRKVRQLHEVFHFRHVVLHPFPYSRDQVELLRRIFCHDAGIPALSFESMLRKQDIPKEDFDTLFEDPHVGLLLDAAHAAAAETSASEYTFSALEKYFARVTYVHLSSVRRDLAYHDETGFFCPSKGHSLFTQTNESDLLLFNPVRTLLQCKPFLGLVLEQGFKVADTAQLYDEIEFVRSYFIAGVR